MRERMVVARVSQLKLHARIAVLCLAITAIIGCGHTWAASVQEKSVIKGEAHYLFFCANCHGVNADGKGPYARLLKLAPTDLTVLRRNGEQSVAERVMNAITGRHEVGEGQEPKMPIFSENLEIETVYQITEYLKTIQK